MEMIGQLHAPAAFPSEEKPARDGLRGWSGYYGEE
jgi:hypothetical protein